jgi:hypothetical protein
MSEDYDMSIHTNPDAAAWAKFFMESKNKNGWEVDEEVMRGWFANAMMAMHDFMENKRRKTETKMPAAENGFDMEDCSLSIKGKDLEGGPFDLSITVKGPFKVHLIQSMTYKELGDPVDSLRIQMDLLKIYTPEEMKAREEDMDRRCGLEKKP